MHTSHALSRRHTHSNVTYHLLSRHTHTRPGLNKHHTLIHISHTHTITLTLTLIRHTTPASPKHSLHTLMSHPLKYTPTSHTQISHILHSNSSIQTHMHSHTFYNLTLSHVTYSQKCHTLTRRAHNHTRHTHHTYTLIQSCTF